MRSWKILWLCSGEITWVWDGWMDGWMGEWVEKLDGYGYERESRGEGDN